MKILYGVQGTGNGHVSRTKALIPALERPAVEIDFVFSGRPREEFFDMHSFGEFRVLEGLILIFDRGRVQIIKTILANRLINFLVDIWRLDLSGYDLVISDFEPITAWSAKLRGVPCIALSHQCAFKYDVPKLKGYWLSKLIMRIFAPSTTAIGFHYHHFNQPILPPLIGMQKKGECMNKKILVYMGFEALSDIVEFVSPFTQYEFQIFAKVKKIMKFNHIVINPLSHDDFHEQLKDCSGVISNAGFELSSEALSYGKKLLVKPLAGQYEQLCNVTALESIGRATSMDSLDQAVLASWLEGPEEEPIFYPDVATPLADWILSPDRTDLQTLSDSIWDH